MNSNAIKGRIRSLSQFDLKVNHFSLGLDESLGELPFIEFSRISYPGVEAHLFTIADASLWHPEITSTLDVALRGLSGSLDRFESWNRLLSNIRNIMSSLELYRQKMKQGIIPSTIWAHHELQWYRRNWTRFLQKPTPMTDFLDSVDKSIKCHIKELNDLGLTTTQSCSGLACDHPDREPYLPYVMFDERTYPKISAHLFTLADMTGWIPSYGPHNFDVELRLKSSENAERSWNLLVEGARFLTLLLNDHRQQFIPNSSDLEKPPQWRGVTSNHVIKP
jgi:hypothetical protein